jgi:hypothetical protein
MKRTGIWLITVLALGCTTPVDNENSCQGLWLGNKLMIYQENDSMAAYLKEAIYIDDQEVTLFKFGEEGAAEDNQLDGNQLIIASDTFDIAECSGNEMMLERGHEKLFFTKVEESDDSSQYTLDKGPHFLSFNGQADSLWVINDEYLVSFENGSYKDHDFSRWFISSFKGRQFLHIEGLTYPVFLIDELLDDQTLRLKTVFDLIEDSQVELTRKIKEPIGDLLGTWSEVSTDKNRCEISMTADQLQITRDTLSESFELSINQLNRAIILSFNSQQELIYQRKFFSCDYQILQDTLIFQFIQGDNLGLFPDTLVRN